MLDPVPDLALVRIRLRLRRRTRQVLGMGDPMQAPKLALMLDLVQGQVREGIIGMVVRGQAPDTVRVLEEGMAPVVEMVMVRVMATARDVVMVKVVTTKIENQKDIFEKWIILDCLSRTWIFMHLTFDNKGRERLKKKKFSFLLSSFKQ